MSRDIKPLIDFVNLTHRAQEMNSSHRIYFSKRLYDLCQRQPFDDEYGLDFASGIVEVLEANLWPTETFPTILLSHFWSPCIHRLPDDDGRLQLYLTLFNETRAGAALMVQNCLEIHRFHEYAPGERKQGRRVRVFFSERLKRRCKQRNQKFGSLDIEWQLFVCANFTPGSTEPSFSWLMLDGIRVCAFQPQWEFGPLRVYYMLAAECPAKASHPGIAV